MSFVHLHTHTTFSMLDGVSKREDIIKKAVASGMPAVSITEHGNIHNAVSFYRECAKHSIKPIIGLEAYVAPDNRFGRTYTTTKNDEVSDVNKYAYHMTLIAKNKEGIHNLMKLSTLSYREGFYRKPRIDMEIQSQYSRGIICLSGCLGSITSQLIISGQEAKAIETLDKLRMIFGDDFYIEVMNHGIFEEGIVGKSLIEFSKLRDVPAVLTGDSHFTEPEHADSHEVALCIGTNRNMQDPSRFKFQGSGYWYKTPEEMNASAVEAGYPSSVISNTLTVASKVEDYRFKLGKSIIPLFTDSDKRIWRAEDCHDKLKMRSYGGLCEIAKYRPEVLSDKRYVERLEFELDMIKRKNFSSYFLIIADIVNFMYTKLKILKPVGRGSSVGSLVCYAVGITGMDPVEWSIPFYRFINEGRKDLPDIDTDISQRHRQDVIDYIIATYGHDKVALICTFTAMAARGVIDSVGMALDIPPSLRRFVSKLMDEDESITDDSTLDDIFELPKVAELLQQYPTWLKHCKVLEGNYKAVSSHAAGVIIGNEPLENIIPLHREKDGHLVTQFDMVDTSALGLLKLDMLGLKNLDIIQDSFELIASLRGYDNTKPGIIVKPDGEVFLNFYSMPHWDKETHAMLSGGKYVSVFQYDSHGMRKMAKRLQPESLEHLMALNALYRPGPLKRQKVIENGKEVTKPSIADSYIARRHGLEKIEEWHPDLKPIFARTFGMPIYQEQISEMSKVIAGFNDQEADEYRAAIGKKDQVKFDAAQNKFKARGMERGHSEAFMNDLCDKLLGFARYCWNIGHCLHAPTLIKTCDRGLVPIKDIKVGEMVWSVNEKTGDLFRNRVVNVLNKGVNKLVKVTSSDGRSILCTDSHRFFTSEHTYKHASKLVPGDFLKMLENRAAWAHLDVDVAPSAHGNEVPLVVSSDNVEWDYVVKPDADVLLAKSTREIVTVEQFPSNAARYLPAFAGASVPGRTNTPEILVNTSRVDGHPTLGKPSSYRRLRSKPAAVYLRYGEFDFWGDSVDFVAPEAVLLKESAKGRWGALERELTKDANAAVPFFLQGEDKVSINPVWIALTKAEPALTVSNLSVIVHGDANAATDAVAGLSAGPLNTPLAHAANYSVIDYEDIAAPSTGDADFHLVPPHIIVPEDTSLVTSDCRVGSVVDTGRDGEVWDLTMEGDPNFIANDFVVHNSTGYSYISFVTAFLETHFPLEYYTAILNSAIHSDATKASTIISKIVKKGVEIKPPDVNNSVDYYTTDGKSIWMGMMAIKLMGPGYFPSIVVERENGGPYKSFLDFCVRMTQPIIGEADHKYVKEHVVKNLKEGVVQTATYSLKAPNSAVKKNMVKAGMFDFDKSLTKKDMLAILDEDLGKIIKKISKTARPNAELLYNELKLKGCITGAEVEPAEAMAFEREVLNFYVSGHPIDKYVAMAERLYLDENTRVIQASDINDMQVNVPGIIVGKVERKAMKEARSNGSKYLQLGLSDKYSTESIAVFSNLAFTVDESVPTGAYVIAHGTTRENKNSPGQTRIMIDGVENVTMGIYVTGVIVDAFNSGSAKSVAEALGAKITAEYSSGKVHVAKFAEKVLFTPTHAITMRGEFKLLIGG